MFHCWSGLPQPPVNCCKHPLAHHRLLINHNQSDTEDPGLTELDLSNLDISQVASDVVVGVVTKLERVVIGWCVTPDQLQAIFTRLQFGGSRLKDLTVLGGDLSAVTPEIFLGALRAVESVVFDKTTFSTDQVRSILTMQTEGSQGKLKKLEIFQPNVEDEAYDLLEAAEENDILEIEL